MGRSTVATQEMSEQQEQPTITEKAPVFTKEQLIASAAFSGYRDALNVILDNNKSYTMKDAEAELKKFKERKVK